MGPTTTSLLLVKHILGPPSSLQLRAAFLAIQASPVLWQPGGYVPGPHPSTLHLACALHLLQVATIKQHVAVLTPRAPVNMSPLTAQDIDIHVTVCERPNQPVAEQA